MIKTHTFNGKKFAVSIHEGGLHGYCLNDPKEPYEICIAVPLDTRNGLETATHEAIHALYPKLKEDQVEYLARELARWLWRLGYRHIERK